MTVEEALAVLDQVAAAVVGTRADHEKVAQALDTLRAAVQPAALPAD